MAQPQTVLQFPEPVDATDFHFKLASKLQIFDPLEQSAIDYCHLITISNRFGLIFVGTPKGFYVLKSKQIASLQDTNAYPRREVLTTHKPTHLSLNCDQTLLAVGCKTGIGCQAFIYNVTSFLTQFVTKFKEIRLSPSPESDIHELSWNPGVAKLLTVCFVDGSVGLMEIKPSTLDINTLPPSSQSTCYCWSPKGKQIVVGNTSGMLIQYKPDLKAVKSLPAPTLNGNQCAVVNVHWISNYQFVGVYQDVTGNSFPVVMIVNAPKNEPITFINYEDVTYSNSKFRNHQFYILHQPTWNMLFICSCNSVETAILHLKEDNITWEQLLPGDSSRAELPLNQKKQETYPIGLALDTSTEHKLPWGEDFLAPMPVIAILSHEGVLCFFNVVNLLPNSAQICSPPENEADSSLFVYQANTSTTDLTAPKTEPILSEPKAAAPSVPAAPLFSSKPTISFGGVLPLPTSTPSIGTQFGTTPASITPFSGTSFNLGGTSIFGKTTSTPEASSITSTPQAIVSASIQTSLQSQSFQSFSFKDLSSANQSFSLAKSSSQSKIFSVPPQSATSLFGAKPNIDMSIKQPPQETFQVVQSSEYKQPVKQQQIVEASPAPREVESFVLSTISSQDPPQTISPVPSPATPEPPVVDNSVYINAITEDIDHFNKELEQLASKIKNVFTEVGTQEDKVTLREKLDSLTSFWKELKETTLAQSSEIHGVKADLMETFAWLEDAKSRQRQYQNFTYLQLKRSEELDPISDRHMTEINQLQYYVESQLKQLNTHLDKEWLEHQNSYRQEVKGKMKTPSMEYVYKTMHLQIKILNKQKSIIEDLKSKLSEKNRKIKSRSTLVLVKPAVKMDQKETSRSSELSKLAENLLQLKIGTKDEIPISTEDNLKLIMQAKVNMIKERSRKLSLKKQSTLRNFLLERETVKIRQVKSTCVPRSFTLPSKPIVKDKPLAEVITTKKVEKKLPSVTAMGAVETKSQDIKEKFYFHQINASSTPLREIQKVETEPSKPDVIKTVVQKSVMEPVKPQPSLDTAFSFSSKSLGTPDLSSFSKVDISVSKADEAIITPVSKPSSDTSNKIQLLPLSSTAVNNNVLTPQISTSVTKTTAQDIFTQPMPFTFSGQTTKSIFDTPKKSDSQSTFSFQFGNSVLSSSSSIFGGSKSIITDASSNKVETSQMPSEKGFTFSFNAGSKPNTFKAEADSASSIFENSANKLVDSNTKSDFAFSLPTPLTEVKPNIFQPRLEETSETAKSSALSLFTSVSSQSQSSMSSFTFKIPSLTPAVIESEEPKTPLLPTTVFSLPISTSAVSTTTVAVSPSIKVSETSSLSESISSPIVHAAPVSATVISSESTNTVLPTVVSTQSSFAQLSAATTITTPNIFGESLTTPTIFSTPTPPSTQAIVTAVAMAPSAGTVSSIFSSSPSVTSSNNLFSQSPIFGQSLSSSSIKFGSPTATTTTTTTTSSPSIFGLSTTSSAITTTSSQSIFGQPTSPATSSFGQTSSINATTNLFGQLMSSPSGSVFGSTTSTAPLTIFGQSSKPLFEQSSSTTNLFTSPSTTTNVFAQSPTTSSPNLFTQPTTSTSTSFFGQNICSPFSSIASTVAPNQNPFAGSGTTFGSKPVFGQNLFSPSSTSSSIFGNTGVSPVFGGTTSSSSNLFQSPNTSAFGTSSPTGPFSGGSSSIAQSGFGSPPTFQKSGGFGSPPLFGSSATSGGFGSAATFGSSPSFGSSSTFGSGAKIFGSSSPTSTFGSTQPTTFETLATQPTVGFGNLAQQNQNQRFGGGGGGGFGSSTFGNSNNPTFGGNAFSNWR